MSETKEGAPARPATRRSRPQEGLGRRGRRRVGRRGPPGSESGPGHGAATEDRAAVARLLVGFGNVTGGDVLTLRRRIYEKRLAGELSRLEAHEAQSMLTGFLIGGMASRRRLSGLADRAIEREKTRLPTPPVKAARRALREVLAEGRRTRLLSALPDLVARAAARALDAE